MKTLNKNITLPMLSILESISTDIATIIDKINSVGAIGELFFELEKTEQTHTFNFYLKYEKRQLFLVATKPIVIENKDFEESNDFVIKLLQAGIVSKEHPEFIGLTSMSWQYFQSFFVPRTLTSQKKFELKVQERKDVRGCLYCKYSSTEGPIDNSKKICKQGHQETLENWWEVSGKLIPTEDIFPELDCFTNIELSSIIDEATDLINSLRELKKT